MMQSLLFGLIVCTILSAQTPAERPQFEVASVKPSAKDLPPAMREMRRGDLPGIPMDDPGRMRLEGWALLDLIAVAYNVHTNQISGPAWISDQGFDIEAKIPEGTPTEQLNAMLQSLLEERFGLKVHRDTQTKQGFALVVGKNGPKLEPAGQPLSPEQRQARFDALAKRMQESGENGTPMKGYNRFRAPSVTCERLASMLVRLTEAPVVDETGLTGKYSVEIETWKNPDLPGGTVFEAVEKLGLKLVPRKVTLEIIVVDQVSKTPTAN